MNHAFICHASEDKPIARKLANDLERHGITVWLDERRIKVGDSLREKIDEALEQSQHVIILVSSSSMKKEWVKKEFNAAFSLEISRGSKMILPVILDKTIAPPLIRDKLYADIGSSYSEGLKQIVSAIAGKNPQGEHERLENISCTHTLQFMRLDGSLVNYSRMQVLQCLDGQVSGYQEELAADGYVDCFNVSPGSILAIRKRTDKTLIDTDFGRVLQKGGRIKRVFSCKYRDSFCAPYEYFEAPQHSPTRRVKIQCIFLKGRPPTQVDFYERRGSDEHVLNSNPQLIQDSQGRPCLNFDVKAPRLLSSYGLRWRW